MNTEKVYLCNIYELEDINYEDINVSVDKGNGFNYDNIIRTKYKTRFIKKALVYYSEFHRRYIDLETKEKYKFGYSASDIGDLFVDTLQRVTTVSKIIDSNSKNMSRRRILKKYNEATNRCDINECK